MKKLTIILLILSLAACQTQPTKVNFWANWTLNTESSQLTFVSTKNKSIAETHSIKFHSGEINGDSTVNLTLDLNQVETQIPIRNDRMKALLFETNQFPTANITAEVAQDLALNTQSTMNFNLYLHGQTQTLEVAVVAQMVDDELIVTNYDPITIQAKDFDLDDGINQLTTVAKLQSISYEVPVDFKLVFNKIKPNNQ